MKIEKFLQTELLKQFKLTAMKKHLKMFEGYKKDMEFGVGRAIEEKRIRDIKTEELSRQIVV